MGEVKQKVIKEEPVQNLVKGKHRIYCYITVTKNNTFIVIKNLLGNILRQSSAGRGKEMMGRKRRTIFAAEKLGFEIGARMVSSGFSLFRVKIRGIIRKRALGVVRGLVRSGLRLNRITYPAAVPHNGTKQKKRRRL
jgi:small subunit ribosomal protein S11